MSDTPNDDAATTGKAPEFDGEFDAEKAKTAIANLRTEVAALKERNAAVITERDEFKAAAEKTGEDRDTALKAAVERAETAERTLAISDAKLPDDVVTEFADYLTGSAEEVREKAKRLAARLLPPEDKATGDDPADDADKDKGGDAPKAPPARPAPALVPGDGGDASEPFDPVAVAKAARRS